MIKAQEDTEINIVFLTTLYPDSGSQTLTQVPHTLHYFVKQWIKDGHHVQVVKIVPVYAKLIPFHSNQKKIKKAADTILEGVNIHIIQAKIGLNLRYSVPHCIKTGEAVAAFLKKNNISCDVVVFHIFMPGFYIANQIRICFDVPMVYGVHKTDVGLIKKPYLRKKIRANESAIDAFAFRTGMLKIKFESFYRLETKSFAVPSGIPGNVIERVEADQNHRRTFVTVASFKPGKNIELVIKAFAVLAKEYADIELLVVGDGRYREKLHRLAGRSRCGQRIRFLGSMPRDQVFQTLKSSDIFIMPSINETFGMVYLEAMAKGCITIGTRGEGIDGVLVDGINGFLCTPTVAGCCEKMKQALMLSGSELEEILENTYQTAMEYEEKTCSRAYIRHIQDTIGIK